MTKAQTAASSVIEEMVPARQSSTARLIVKRAESYAEMEAAMRLRFEVFNLELNEGLQASYLTGMDTDEYDEYCDHIIVMDTEKDMVVGAYRLLPGSRAERGPGFYSETEFELSAIKRIEGEKVELGRACVRHAYRGSATLNLMWSGIARYIEEHRIGHLFGCGSIHTINPLLVSGIYSYLKTRYLTGERFRVTPIKRVPGFDPDAPFDKKAVAEQMPPLLSAYLRLGARIAGEPALDEQFGVSDLLIILDRDKILDRYKRHYFV
ncbi:MAG: GNAT family N-acetyltransferase [Nitrospirae bacterium]|nr:MAG: GNAT family N-acetyltransferase [Nitrospirota bacterium]